MVSAPDSISDEIDGSNVGTLRPARGRSGDAVGDSDTSNGSGAAVSSAFGVAVGAGIGIAVGELVGDSEGDNVGVQSMSCNGYETQLPCRGHSLPR